MGIFGFLVGLGCLVLIAWAIALLGHVVFGRKPWQQNRPQEPPSLAPPEIQERNSPQPPIAAPQEQPSPKPTQFRERFGSPQPPIAAPPTPIVPRRRVVALRQSPVSTRVRLPSSRHQQYIQLADSVLKRLRDRITVAQLPETLAILRKMNPYAFEELLLTCCQEQGWEIGCSFRYSGDGGIDGRILIAGKLRIVEVTMASFSNEVSVT